MAGYKKKGPSRKAKKTRKSAPAKLTAAKIMRGKSAKLRRTILPV